MGRRCLLPQVVELMLQFGDISEEKMHTISAFTLALSMLASQTATNKDTPVPVTVTGCIHQGVECLRLTDPNNPGKLLYSIARTDKLKLGHAYLIHGQAGNIGFCMEGKPILTPKEITEIRRPCAEDQKPKK
jgi:hypothetical protein